MMPPKNALQRTALHAAADAERSTKGNKMKTSVKIALGMYLLVMAGCVAAFFVQQSVVYGDHIRPGREQSRFPVAVTFKDKVSGEIREAEIAFVNDAIAANPLRMGNEIEEHLLSLMTANLATGAMLVFLVIAGFRSLHPAIAGNA
jgi:hypothetical protein